MPVDRVVTRGSEPGQVLKEHIEALEKSGCQIGSVLPLWDEVLIVYSKPKRETRAPRETRG